MSCQSQGNGGFGRESALEAEAEWDRTLPWFFPNGQVDKH